MTTSERSRVRRQKKYLREMFDAAVKIPGYPYLIIGILKGLGVDVESLAESFPDLTHHGNSIDISPADKISIKFKTMWDPDVFGRDKEGRDMMNTMRRNWMRLLNKHLPLNSLTAP